MLEHKHNREVPILDQYSSATVMGLGQTGFSVVRYLCAHGIAVTVMDSRPAPVLAEQLRQDYPGVKAYYGEFDFAHLRDATLIVSSPGVALSEPVLVEARQHGAHIVGDIELFLQQNTQPVIGITGSNGKSTVTTLVGDMLAGANRRPLVAGNIGRPALDALTDGEDYDVAVLELSSFQLETMSQFPGQAAAILNISADHMDRYSSMGDYRLAKARILRGAKRAILPRHDTQLGQITHNCDAITFDLDEPANDDYGVHRNSSRRWLMKGKQRLIPLRDVPLTGLHNVKNVLAAYALVDFLDLPLESLNQAVKSFTGLPHRMQTVAIADQVSWVNDSKATNVGATSTALLNLENEVVWIAGGQGKDADFEELRDAITAQVKLLILIGEDADLIDAALQGLLPIEHVKSMREAVHLAAGIAQAGTVVLLSPACASFDMYDNFEQRGDAFAAEVHAYLNRSAA